MLGDYVLHYPITDFAVSLLAVAALIEIARVVLKRATWSHAVDLLLVLGFGGALAAVASGLWLTTVQHHPHTGALAIHHWFAYSTLGASGIAVIARALQGRVPRLAAVKSGALLVSAVLVTGAGFYGGRMAHGGESHHSHREPLHRSRITQRLHRATPESPRCRQTGTRCRMQDIMGRIHTPIELARSQRLA